MTNYDLEFQDLESFAALYNYRSYTKAAEKLYITQPALSRRISALEEELGVKLVERSGPRIDVTQAGEHLYKRCLKLMNEKDSLYTSMNRFRSGDAGVLRVGFDYTFNLAYALKGLTAVSCSYPEIQINFEILNSAKIKRFLKEDSIDLAYTYLNTVEDIPDLTNVIISRNRLLVAVGRTHRFFERDNISWEELRGERICCPLNPGDYTWSRLSEWAHNAGAPFIDTIFANSIEEALVLVATGRCISFSGEVSSAPFSCVGDYVRYIPISEVENRLGWSVITYASENSNPLIHRLISQYDIIA